LNATRHVNEETKNFNRKLNKLATKLKHTNIISADLLRNFFTRHGLHMKNSGKEELTSRVVEAIRSTKGICTEIIPINLTWKANTLTSTKGSQVKICLGTDTVDIKNETFRLNSLKTKGEIQHVGNKIFCGCNGETREKDRERSECGLSVSSDVTATKFQEVSKNGQSESNLDVSSENTAVNYQNIKAKEAV
jgi:phosphotransferase system IIA component